VTLPREARDGLSRVWLEILREKHADVLWVVDDRNDQLEPAAQAVESAVAA
jgi:hypothetical protein